MNKRQFGLLFIVCILIFSTSCNSQPATPVFIELATRTASATTEITGDPTEFILSSPAVTGVIPITGHLMSPAEEVPDPVKLVHDVSSSATGAPYGDSYEINLLERPFLADMTYIPDLDIVTFSLSEDADWYYIILGLNGTDPNNPVGIHYGVEINLNANGNGDILIWASPPYTTEWTTNTVQVFMDSDQDTAGTSSVESDPRFEGNGYETLFFDGGISENDDPDLAWVRLDPVQVGAIQFAFKKTWIGPSFMYGVIADAGLKDVTQFDYNDRYRHRNAGSPIRTSSFYPLGALYAVDNTCWESQGRRITGFEPKLCPQAPVATATNRPRISISPTSEPPTRVPATDVPTTAVPTTSVPPTGIPTIGLPTTSVPPATTPFTPVPNTLVPPPPQPTEELSSIVICHISPGNPDQRKTMNVSQSAWENEHSRHGDTLGGCP